MQVQEKMALAENVCSDDKSDLQAGRSVNLECDAGKREVLLKNSI